MQPSSLVFVAVVAIWAAWFVPHWIRRREHLSTARSVDRFSEAMRVLDRDGAVPLRVRRRELVSAGASQAGAVVGSSPAVSVGSSPLHARTSGARAEATRASALTDLDRGEAPTSDRTSIPRDRRPGVPSGARRPPRSARTRRSVLGRRVRGIVLVAALAAVPVLAVLAALGQVPWWSIGVAAGVVLLSVFTLRMAAVREQTSRRTAYAMRPRVSTPARAEAVPAPVTEPAPVPERDLDTPPGDSPPRVTAYRAGDPTWSPVPVPRPTYALKDPAPRREDPAAQHQTEPGVDVAQAPSPGPARRVVGG